MRKPQSKVRLSYPPESDPNALKTRWRVVYYAYCHTAGKEVRKWDYGDLAKYQTYSERLAAGKRLEAAIRRKMDRAGWQIVPELKVPRAKPQEAKRYAQPMAVGKALHITIEDLTKLRKKTRQGYEAKVRVFQRWLEANGHRGLQLVGMRLEIAQGFMQSVDAGRHSTTYNAYRTTMCRLFKPWVERGTIPANPFEKIGTQPRNKTGAKTFTAAQRAEIEAYMLEKDVELWFFTRFVYMQFIRPNELRLLQVRDIDRAGGLITIRGEIAKNKKTQSVQLVPQMDRLIEQYGLDKGRPEHYVFGRGGKPGPYLQGTNTMGERMRRILRKLGYPKGYCLYSWKHTGAQTLARQKEVPLRQIQLQCRHSSLHETQIYLQGLGVSDFDRAVLRFPE
ncbi:site-specific integrase [Nostoc sp. NIES-2111]